MQVLRHDPQRQDYCKENYSSNAIPAFNKMKAYESEADAVNIKLMRKPKGEVQRQEYCKENYPSNAIPAFNKIKAYESEADAVNMKLMRKPKGEVQRQDYCKDGMAQGFTLIELLIVIAMIAILTAIALPSYTHYIDKARMAEILTAIGPAQTMATEYALTHSGFTGFDDSWIETSSNSRYIESIHAAENANQVILALSISPLLTQAATETLNFVGTYAVNGVNWECQVPKSSPQIAKIAPSTCVRMP